MMESIGRGVLDTPLSRSMTASARSGLSPPAAQGGHDSWAAAIAAGRDGSETAIFLLRTVEPML